MPVVRRRSRLADPPCSLRCRSPLPASVCSCPCATCAGRCPWGHPLPRVWPFTPWGPLSRRLAWVYLGAVITRFLSPYFPEAALPARYAHHVPVVLAGGALPLPAVGLPPLHADRGRKPCARPRSESMKLAGAGPGGGAPGAQGPGASAFPLQQPELHQLPRPDDPPRAREMCILLAEFFRRAWPWVTRPA